MKFKNTGVIAVLVLLLIFGFVLFGKSDQNQKKESLPPEVYKTEKPIKQPADIAVLTDEETVVDFVRQYTGLPDYYITKDQARKLGWIPETGNLCEVLPGKAIGGDRFGNRENKLPKSKSRKYFEADLNYNCGRRGADRLIYSSDGLIFITKDHYKTFQKR
ncbi:MAG: ribonuclease domain-containing protein [Moheibacter sp.]